MQLLMKSALNAPQLRSRIMENGCCSPLEVYLGCAEDLSNFQGLDLVDQLIGEDPAFSCGHPSELLYIFHLPVSTSFNLEALAFNAESQGLVRGYIQALRDRGFPTIRLLTHLECRPETIRELGLGEALIQGLSPFAAPDVELYIEQTQFYTADAKDIRVFPAWEDSIFRYRHWLATALPTLQLRTVVDVCHVMNSQRALQILGHSQTSLKDALLSLLRRNADWGPDHFHISCGRGCQQGMAWHGCGFDTEEERHLLRTLLSHLIENGYSGALVTETNEACPLAPRRMHLLRHQIEGILTELKNLSLTEEEHP